MPVDSVELVVAVAAAVVVVRATVAEAAVV